MKNPSQQFTPLMSHELIAVFARVLQSQGEPVVFRAIGHRLGAGLEIAIYSGEIYITTFAATPPSTALTGLVNFARNVRAAGVPCRVNLYVHAASLPF